jgi:hypothetical protein
LKYRGKIFADVWFKPEGEPFALTFRIPRTSFQVPDLGQRLTAENLLKAVGRAVDQVESWSQEGETLVGSNGPAFDLGCPLRPPPENATHLILHVRLKPPPESVASAKGDVSEISEAQWQGLEAQWNAILGVEASIETLRISMESLKAELEGLYRRALTPDQKVNVLNADVAQWNKAKSRVHHALPKMREFIHRSVWAAGTPERKKLDDLFKNHIQHRIPFPGMDEVAELLENLLKDRQVLCAHGTTIYQDCKTVSAELQGARRTMEANAAANAIKKRRRANAKRKFTG